MRLTKNDTLIIKFSAIVLMLIHHLFGFPTRLHSVGWTSSFGIFSDYFVLETTLASFGKICIAIFLFMSGYGNVNAVGKKVSKSIFQFLFMYWSVFLSFSFLAWILDLNKMEFGMHFPQVIYELLGITFIRNQEWWYIQPFLILMLLSPLIFALVRKSPVTALILSVLLSGTLGKFGYIHSIGKFQLFFVLGAVFGSADLFSHSKFLFFEKYWGGLANFIVLGLSVFLRQKFGESLDPVLVILWVWHIPRVIPTNKVTLYLGRASGMTWLVHSFFIYSLFQKFSFWHSNSLIILTQQLALGAALFALYSFLSSKVSKWFRLNLEFSNKYFSPIALVVLSIGIAMPKIKHDTLVKGEIWLDRVEMTRVEQAHFQPRLRLNTLGRYLSVDGEIFKNGIGTHAPSRLSWLIPKGFSKLTFAIAADDQSAGLASFYIQSGDSILFESGELKKGIGIFRFEIPVREGQLIVLGTKEGDSANYDYMDWLEVKLSP